MSTSLLYHAFQIEGVKYKFTSYEGNNIIFKGEINEWHIQCPVCKSIDLSGELLNYFIHPISNGRTEGINNKIKTMKRQAYGFRDIEYFKLRLYHLHNQRYSFAG